MDKSVDIPASVAEIFSRMERLFPYRIDQVDTAALAKDDVLIAGGPKSGTTWAQQILHGLRSGGNMDFKDINALVPIATIIDHSEESKAWTEQPFLPRMYKTHKVADACSKTVGKIVVLVRNPNDAALSLYHYFANWVFKPEELSVDEFIDWFYVHTYPENVVFMNAHQMKHLASWYPRRKDENVLWIHYEDLKADLPKCVRLMSDFLGLGVGDQKLLDLVVHQASFEFMKQHGAQFESPDFKRARNAAAGLPLNAGLMSGGNAGKVRSGNVSDSKHTFSPDALKKLHTLWIQMLKPITGFDNYEEMRSAINLELGRTFN